MARHLLIRSGVTDWEEEDRLRGDYDIPLSTAGRAEVTARLHDVAPYRFATCWAGTDQPARETADILAGASGRRLRTHDGLREVHLGYFQGLLDSDARRKHRHAYAEWREDPAGATPPGAEPLAAAATRVRRALREIDRRHPGDELVALVCSPFVAAVVACVLTGRPLAHAHAILAGMPATALVAPETPVGAIGQGATP